MAVKELEAPEALHNVYFLDCGGRLVCPPARVPHGQGVRPPAYAPEPPLEFLGWSRSTARVTQDVYCVAVTREKPREPGGERESCRVLVLELRGQRRAALFPLGNWEKGETLTRDDLSCLHLRRVERLRPFRCPVVGDTLLAVTDFGVRAFDTALRPLEGLLELMPAAYAAQTAPQRAPMPAGYGAPLEKEA
ncbi:MAG: hypothetical protein LBB75_03930 [Oscillospiraceae bacterium]|jgi:hypothetical protein|nr:hypothetical protein [Oscillospiraceae bacterium]